MSPRLAMIRTILNSIAFLTLLPIRADGGLTPAEMGRFPACYPLVGLILGLISFVLATLLSWTGLPTAAAAIFLVTAQIVLTRGFHLDGLADSADALLSHRSVERKLEIFKDSHLGTFGVLAIVLDVLLKASLISALALDGRFPPHLLLLYPLWGRLAASVVATRSRYARPGGGLGHDMVAHSGPRELWVATLYGQAISLLFGPWSLACAIVALLAGFLLARLWRHCLGGVTGDLLGATVELGEIVSLAAFALVG
ncbi:MAG: adenosylcobinamide-GDP ribazoletransferase [Deltaproteobacteria bacterium]|jgi:adenosylcobinamide-GDP ribazoletransferase|nr:adenosylcobinamide-GDP ribazoletransferase [Deltaproteobacteria bacterium]